MRSRRTFATRTRWSPVPPSANIAVDICAAPDIPDRQDVGDDRPRRNRAKIAAEHHSERKDVGRSPSNPLLIYRLSIIIALERAAAERGRGARKAPEKTSDLPQFDRASRASLPQEKMYPRTQGR